MRPPGDAASGCRGYGAYSRQELEQEPVTQNDEGRYGYEENKDQSQHPRPRIENDVSPHYAGDGATGPERGKGGVVIKNNVCETRTNAANEIEEEVGEVAEVVFDVVAENPEEEHVSCDMHKAAVQEHTGENGEKRGFEVSVAAESAADVGGDGGVGHHEGLVLVRRQSDLVEEHDDVRQNEKCIDDRIGPAWVQVFERDEHSLVSPVCLVPGSVFRVEVGIRDASRASSAGLPL